MLSRHRRSTTCGGVRGYHLFYVTAQQQLMSGIIIRKRNPRWISMMFMSLRQGAHTFFISLSSQSIFLSFPERAQRAFVYEKQCIVLSKSAKSSTSCACQFYLRIIIRVLHTCSNISFCFSNVSSWKVPTKVFEFCWSSISKIEHRPHYYEAVWNTFS